jgi:hypothetical protein
MSEGMDGLSEELAGIWDDLHNAIQQVMVAQPTRLSAAVEELDRQRLRMNGAVRRVTFAHAHAPTASAPIPAALETEDAPAGPSGNP